MLTVAIIAAQVALLAGPEAARPETTGSISEACAAFGKPAPPARIEGQVVSRDRKPRPNVQVRAMLPETGREYTTVSDRNGRFTVAGFDADVSVDLELADATVSWMTGCSVQLTRRAPEVTLTIVLDEPRPGVTVSDVGCEGLASLVATRGTRFLPREPRKEPPPVRLDLRARDIAAVSFDEHGATVWLNESARKELQAFTVANLNRPAVVAIDGMSTTRGAPFINGVVDSGVLGVSEEALRGPLCKALEAAPRARR